MPEPSETSLGSLGLGLESVGDLTNLRLHGSVDNDDSSSTFGDLGTGKDHTDSVTDGTVILLDGLLLLGNGERFTGKESFVTFQVTAVTINDSTIGWDDVTVLDQDDISGDDLVDGDSLGLGSSAVSTSSNNGSLGSTDRLERGNGLCMSALRSFQEHEMFLMVTHLLGLPFSVSTDSDIHNNQGCDNTTRNPIHCTERDSHSGNY